MAPAPKLRILPGLFAFLLPWLLLATWGGLLVAWLGGLDELSRILGMAGPSFHRIAGLSLASTVVLASVLFYLGAGRTVPLVLPTVFALVPWWLGVRGSLRGMEAVFTAVAPLTPEDQGLMLMQGTGELQCLRLLGAWFATALLLATAGGLLLASWSLRRENPDAVSTEAVARRIEALLVALLAAVAWLAAFEALRVAETFFAVVGADAADRDLLLAAGAEQLKPLGLLRLGVLTGLVLALLSLGRRRLAKRPRQRVALGSLGLVGLLVAGTLWADGRPLARMRDALQQPNAP